MRLRSAWITKKKQEEREEFLSDRLHKMYEKRFRDLAEKQSEEIGELCKRVRDSGKTKFDLDEEVINRKVIRDLIS